MTHTRSMPGSHYKANRRLLTVDGAMPEGPVFVMFHGGGWVGGAPEDQLDWARFVARMGCDCHLVEYATKNRFDATVDDAFQDARDAAAHIAGFYPDHPLIFVGHSAGAPLAFEAGLHHQSQLAGLIFMSAVADLGPGGFHNKQVPDTGRTDLSPQHRLSQMTIGPDGPFLLAYHSEADEVVPVSQVARFVEAWQAAGARTARLSRFAGKPHGFQNLPVPRAAIETDLLSSLAALGFPAAAALDPTTAPGA